MSDLQRQRGWVVVPKEQQLLTVEMDLGRGQYRNMFVGDLKAQDVSVLGDLLN